MLLLTRVYYRMLSIQLMSIKLSAPKIPSEFVYCMTVVIGIAMGHSKLYQTYSFNYIQSMLRRKEWSYLESMLYY